MRLLWLFLRFFGYGLLGAQLALAFLRVLSNEPPSDNMAPQAGHVFLALIWIPFGGVLAAAATVFNQQVRANGWVVMFVALVAGVLFVGGSVLAGLLGIDALLFVLPFALHMATTASLRCWQRQFGKISHGES